MTAVSHLGKMGTSHSEKRNDLTRTLWEWCLDNNMWLTTSHIPGKENTLADAYMQSPGNLEKKLNVP